MGILIRDVLKILLVCAALGVGSCNFGADQCSTSRSCPQCISSETPQVERCFQLELLITESTNHPMERESYCTGQCPVILATVDYYCGTIGADIRAHFDECPAYSVEPEGDSGFNEGSQRCANINSCDSCLYGRNNGALRCLQHQLLVEFTNNTGYRNSFCESDCPLTLSTLNWYCGSGNTGLMNPFAVCGRNRNGRFCNEIANEMMTDSDVMQCTSTRNCDSSQCAAAINKYGCCLGSPITVICQLDRCSVETGGSHTPIATPIIIAAMLITAVQ